MYRYNSGDRFVEPPMLHLGTLALVMVLQSL